MTAAHTPLELYIHIPFCIRKCEYCDFLSFSAEEEVKERYVEKLLEEIQAMGSLYGKKNNAGSPYETVSVFLGGGTPSVLAAGQTVRIMSAVKENFCLAAHAEVTTEANPGTVDTEKLSACRACGINRLSLGLQSTVDEELRVLGRIHTFEEFLQSYHSARAAGFDNINIDLMSALPGQTVTSWEHTLRTVTALEPEHISAYSLIIEEGTPFYKKYGEGENPENPARILPLPDEEAERQMYHITKKYLKEQGYERYEISNYARPGKECLHNEGYWTGTEYLGLGLGASSYINGERFSNVPDMGQYLSLGYDDLKNRRHHLEREVLTVQAQMEEYMFLGLRLVRGVSTDDFKKRFGVTMESVYGGVLADFCADGLMEKQMGGPGKDEPYWRLTEYGIDVSNQVFCGFLL